MIKKLFVLLVLLTALFLVFVYFFSPVNDERQIKYEAMGWKEYIDNELGFSIYYPSNILVAYKRDDGVQFVHEIGSAVYQAPARGFPNTKRSPLYDFDLSIEVNKESFYKNSKNDPRDIQKFLESGKEYRWDIYGHADCGVPQFLEFSDSGKIVQVTDRDWSINTGLCFSDGDITDERITDIYSGDELILMRDRILNSFKYLK